MKQLKRLVLLAMVSVQMPIAVTAASEYHDTAALERELRELTRVHANAATLDRYGQSRQGRPLWVLTLAAPGDKAPDERTALLIAAGLDGDRLAGCEIALRVAEKLLEANAVGDATAARLLTEHTVYVIPRANPDAQETYFQRPQFAFASAMRPVDDDRDGAVDEDGPNDLNGDGLITQMRVKDPEATHIADPDEPRLLRKADRAKGEQPVYKVYIEGVDDDGDGETNEDPPGGVDLNANFLHGYQEHASGAGPHQLSEPESRSLVDFVLTHRRIAMAVTFGRHDNLLNVDKSGKMDYTDRAPVTLLEDDASIYAFLGERYKELTGIKKAPKAEAAGAFFAWAYSQYGIPSFAIADWQRPEPEKKEGEGEDEEGDDEAKKKDSGSDDDEPEARRPRRGRGRGRFGGRGGRGGGSEEKEKKKEEDTGEDKAWLKYSDDLRAGTGFVDWQPFDHPTLGKVEIGGFVPFFKTTPPAEALEELAEAQFKFVMDLGGRFPDIVLEPVEVTERDANVFEIRAYLTNRGYFPSGLAIAEKNRRVRPIVVTLDGDAHSILGGQKLHKIWSVPGSGGTKELRWVVRGGRGTTVAIHVTSEKYGDFTRNVVLSPTSSGGGR